MIQLNTTDAMENMNAFLNDTSENKQIYNSIEPDEFEEEDSNIDDDELALLDESGDGDGDDDLLKDAQLDDTDEEGAFLNEKTDLSGSDLDVPGADMDDEDELVGEEDEENNVYSEDDQEDKL